MFIIELTEKELGKVNFPDGFIFFNDPVNDGYTIIRYPSAQHGDDFLRVKETPEEIMAKIAEAEKKNQFNYENINEELLHLIQWQIPAKINDIVCAFQLAVSKIGDK